MKRTIVISLLVSTISTGCGIFPTINCSKTTGIKVGMTEKELINLMGEPYFVSISSKAGKVEKSLGWQNKESPVEATNIIRVKISSDGRVSDYSGKCNNLQINSR